MSKLYFTLNGIDISNYVEETSLHIEHTLSPEPGNFSNAQFKALGTGNFLLEPFYDGPARPDGSTNTAYLDYPPQTHRYHAQSGSSWVVQDGTIQVSAHGTSSFADLLTFDSGIPKNYVFEAKVTLNAAESHRAGLVFRYTDPNNYWYWLIDTTGRSELGYVQSGTPTQVYISDPNSDLAGGAVLRVTDQIIISSPALLVTATGLNNSSPSYSFVSNSSFNLNVSSLGYWTDVNCAINTHNFSNLQITHLDYSTIYPYEFKEIVVSNGPDVTTTTFKDSFNRADGAITSSSNNTPDEGFPWIVNGTDFSIQSSALTVTGTSGFSSLATSIFSDNYRLDFKVISGAWAFILKDKFAPFGGLSSGAYATDSYLYLEINTVSGVIQLKYGQDYYDFTDTYVGGNYPAPIASFTSTAAPNDVYSVILNETTVQVSLNDVVLINTTFTDPGLSIDLTPKAGINTNSSALGDKVDYFNVTTLPGSRIFGGYVDSTHRAPVKGNLNFMRTFSCKDYSYILNFVKVYKAYTGQTDAYILTDLLNSYFPGNYFTSTGSNIASTVTIASITFYSISLLEAIRQLCGRTGAKFLIDVYHKAQYFIENTSIAPCSFSEYGESDPILAPFFPDRGLKVLDFKSDMGGFADRVTLVGGDTGGTDTTETITTVSGSLPGPYTYQLQYEKIEAISSFIYHDPTGYTFPVVWSFEDKVNPKNTPLLEGTFLSEGGIVQPNYSFAQVSTASFLIFTSGLKFIIYSKPTGTDFYVQQFFFERNCNYELYLYEDHYTIAQTSGTNRGYVAVTVVTDSGVTNKPNRSVYIGPGWPIVVDQDTGIINYGSVDTANSFKGGFIPDTLVAGGGTTNTIAYTGSNAVQVVAQDEKAREIYSGNWLPQDPAGGARWHDLVISDSSLNNTAIANAQALALNTLKKRSVPLETLEFETLSGQGLEVGQLVTARSGSWRVNGNFLISKIDIQGLGNKLLQWKVSAGTYYPGDADLMAALIRFKNSTQQQEAIPPLAENFAIQYNTGYYNQFFDYFTRSNGPMAYSPNGYRWGDSATWKIYANQATTTGVIGDKIVAETGLSDGTVTATCANIYYTGIIFRYSKVGSSIKHWVVNQNAATAHTQIYTYDSAVGYSLIADVAGAENYDVLSVQLSGPNIQISRNATIIASITNSFNSTATQHGLFGGDGTNTAIINNFSFSKTPVLTIVDDFNRPAGLIGTTAGGYRWIIDSSNFTTTGFLQASTNGVLDTKTGIETRRSNGVVSVTCGNIFRTGLFFRSTNTSSGGNEKFIYVYNSTSDNCTHITYYDYTVGTSLIPFTTPIAGAAMGDVLTAIFNGTVIKIKRNGVTIWTGITNFQENATIHGLMGGNGGTVAYWNYFSFTGYNG
jgi:hypothetical protein